MSSGKRIFAVTCVSKMFDLFGKVSWRSILKDCVAPRSMRRKLLPILGSVIFFFYSTACAGLLLSKESCLAYEPSVVQLTGTLIRQTFPVPPNYQSVNQGDAPETGWYIQLAHPICVDEDKHEPDLNPAQKSVQKIQLVVDPSVYKTQKYLVGKLVTVSGTLFGAHTGHHHTPVLLTVKSLVKTE